MGASTENYIWLVNCDGEKKKNAQSYYHRWQQAEARIAELESLIESIKKLPIDYKPVNNWEGIKYKPVMKKMIDLDKVLQLEAEIKLLKDDTGKM